MCGITAGCRIRGGPLERECRRSCLPLECTRRADSLFGPMRFGSTALATERVERRLAAILAADVAGYSRLMGADEEGTHERLKAHFRQLIDPKIKEHRGRIVKNTGDGMLAEFSSVVDAVRCAAEIQRGMPSRRETSIFVRGHRGAKHQEHCPASTRLPDERGCGGIVTSRSASTTLANSTSRPSPVVLTRRP